MNRPVSPNKDCHGPTTQVKLVAELSTPDDGDLSGLARLTEAAEAVERMHSERDIPTDGGVDFRHNGARREGLLNQDGSEIDRMMDDNLSRYSNDKEQHQTRSVTAKIKLAEMQAAVQKEHDLRLKAKFELEEAQKRYDLLSLVASPDVSLIDCPANSMDKQPLPAPIPHDTARLSHSLPLRSQNVHNPSTSTLVKSMVIGQRVATQEREKSKQIQNDQIIAEQLAVDLHSKYFDKPPVVSPLVSSRTTVPDSNEQVVTLQKQVIELQRRQVIELQQRILLCTTKPSVTNKDVYQTAASEMSSDTDSDSDSHSDRSNIQSDAPIKNSKPTKNLPKNSQSNSSSKPKEDISNFSNKLKPRVVRATCSKNREKENVTHRPHLKLIPYDGKSSLESFMIQFNTCCDYNKWNEDEKLAQLKMALKDNALNVLLGKSDDLTFEGILKDLQNSFGTNGLEAQYESDLKNRRRKKNETMKAYYQEMHKLSSLAYSRYPIEVRDKMGMDAFIEGLNDSTLALKVRDQQPLDLQSAYKHAQRLESNAQIVGRYDEMKENRRKEVRFDMQARAVSDTEDEQESESSEKQKGKTIHGKNTAKQGNVLGKTHSQLEAVLRRLANLESKNASTETVKKEDNVEPVKKEPKNEITCYTCGEKGHGSKNCPNKREKGSCYNCGENGHYKSNCPHPLVKKYFNKKEGYNAHLAAHGSDRKPSVYLDMKIDNVVYTFLLDSGCDRTLLPSKMVNKSYLRPTRCKVMAANGAQIPLVGEATVILKLGNLEISTEVLVSKHVAEGLIGNEWLTANNCCWQFGQDKIVVQNQTFTLKSYGSNYFTGCRVAAQERIIIPKRCEKLVKGQAIFDRASENSHRELVEFATSSHTLSNGLIVGRVMVPHQCENIPIRILNTSSKPITLYKGTDLSSLEPVRVIEKGEDPEPITIKNPDDWKDGLMKDLNAEIEQETRVKLDGLLIDYADCFSKSEFDLGRTTMVKHKIDTGDNKPVRQTLRRQPLHYLKEIDRQLGELSSQDMVEPASSPWASNIVVVAKKDGSLRMCVDYRGLNNVTRKDSYPLPRIADCLDELSNATFFSTFDLRSGYFQVAMEEEDMDKTCFLTRKGTYRFKSMPFGLSNAPATFQRLMDAVLVGLNHDMCLVYLDDIILFSKSVEDHLIRLKLLFDRLRKANLKLKPSKCHLLQRTVHFLGHVISAGQVATEPEKIEQVVSWPVPKDVTEVRSYLGLVSYYRRFIKSFSEIAAPLHALTGKKVKFQWTEKCQEAFQELKDRLVSSPIVAMPTDDGEFRLDTDASNFAIGAVLSQLQDGQERVIAYASRTLNSAERNYCVTRRELLAVVHFTKQFRTYLLGREFLIRTDHSALRWLKLTPEPIGQQARWLEKLEEYNFRIEHRPGKKHSNADALSRRPCRQCHRNEDTEEEIGIVDSDVRWKAAVGYRPDDFTGRKPPVTFGVSTLQLKKESWTTEEYEEAYSKDPDLKEIYPLIKQKKEQVPWKAVIGQSLATKNYWQQWTRLYVSEGKLYRKWFSTDGTHQSSQLVPPFAMRQDFLRVAHTGLTGGHMGIKKTMDQVQRRAYWSGCSTDVVQFCKRCTECAQYFRGTPKHKGKLQVTEVGEPYERISIDLTGKHPISKSGNVYILTVIDHFTKYAEAIPLRNKEATTVARALFDVVLSRYGLPQQVLSDCGKEFENGLMSELCRLLGIDKLRTVAYKPSTNGAIERFHKSLNSMLGKVVSESQSNWDNFIPSVMAAYRCAPHESTGFTPNFLMFGRENRAPLDLLYGGPEEESQAETNLERYAEEKVLMMKRSYQLARENLNKNGLRMKRYYDMRVKPQLFKKGVWTWFYNPRRFVRRSPKWQRNFTGPYLVVRNLDPVNVVLQKSQKAKPFVTHVDKLKLCLGETPPSWLEDELKPVRVPLVVNPSNESQGVVQVVPVSPDTDGVSNLIDGETKDSQLILIPMTRSGRQVRPPVRYPNH